MIAREERVSPAGDDNAVELSEMLFEAGLWDGKTPIHWPDPWASWRRYYAAMYDPRTLEPGRDYVIGVSHETIGKGSGLSDG